MADRHFSCPSPATAPCWGFFLLRPVVPGTHRCSRNSYLFRVALSKDPYLLAIGGVEGCMVAFSEEWIRVYGQGAIYEPPRMEGMNH
jgi:hypothetical protein